MSWIGTSRFQKYKKRRGRRHLLQNYPVTFKHGVLENPPLMIFQLAVASFYRILVPLGRCVIFGWYAVLVGGFNPSEKYESVGMIIPNIWKKMKNMFQTTNQSGNFVSDTALLLPSSEASQSTGSWWQIALEPFESWGISEWNITCFHLYHWLKHARRNIQQPFNNYSETIENHYPLVI